MRKSQEMVSFSFGHFNKLTAKDNTPHPPPPPPKLPPICAYCWHGQLLIQAHFYMEQKEGGGAEHAEEQHDLQIMNIKHMNLSYTTLRITV